MRGESGSNNKIPGIVKIKTKLWEHQEETVEKIINGYVKEDKKGFGDASCVGAGKTLTALSIMQRLAHHNSSMVASETVDQQQHANS